MATCSWFVVLILNQFLITPLAHISTKQDLLIAPSINQGFFGAKNAKIWQVIWVILGKRVQILPPHLYVRISNEIWLKFESFHSSCPMRLFDENCANLAPKNSINLMDGVFWRQNFCSYSVIAHFCRKWPKSENWFFKKLI